MKVIFDEIAKWELDDAIDYYERKRLGLGLRFEREVRKGISRIVMNPDAWQIETNSIRRYLLHKFPFKIIYSVEPAYIYIIAIAHCHRRPHYWIDRLSPDI